MLDKLQIEDLTIEIMIEKSKRKSLAITVTEEGKLSVKAPLRMSDREIEKFLNQKRFWIYKQVKRMQEEQKNRVIRSEQEVKQLKEQARKVLTEKTDYYKQFLKVEYKRIRIGDQKTRWGSCSSSGTISYNWRLILMPEAILDYVVVHELCHMIEMNHSARFWARVAEILPDYQMRRKWLKENGKFVR